MSKRYVVYVEDGENPPEGAVELVGTFFQEVDVAFVYESLLDGVDEDDSRYLAHQPHLGGIEIAGNDYPCWDALSPDKRREYLRAADRALEDACTCDWVDVVEMALEV